MAMVDVSWYENEKRYPHVTLEEERMRKAALFEEWTKEVTSVSTDEVNEFAAFIGWTVTRVSQKLLDMGVAIYRPTWSRW